MIPKLRHIVNEIKVHRPGFPILINDPKKAMKLLSKLREKGYTWLSGNQLIGSEQALTDILTLNNGEIYLTNPKDSKVKWVNKDPRLNEIKVHRPGLTFPLIVKNKKHYNSISNWLDKQERVWVRGGELASEWNPYDDADFDDNNPLSLNLNGDGSMMWTGSINETKIK